MIVVREAEVTTENGFTIRVQRDREESILVSVQDKGVIPRLSCLDAMALGRAIQMVANALKIVED